MARAFCMVVVFMLATAVVQADQCSSGGEGAGDNEPQNLVSLLQTKLRMNVLEDRSSMMENPGAMLTELEGMVRSGATPAFDLITTIKNLIEDDIMPGLQTTRDAAAEATSDALRKIQSCNNKSKTEEANIEATHQVSVKNARSLHAACREAQKMLHAHNLTDSDSYCVKLGEFLHGATPLEIPEGHSRDQSVKYVQEASLQNMCGRTKVCELDDGCTAAEAELEDKKAECSVNQRSFESEFCTWKIELETNCRNLDTCYSEAAAAYDSHIGKMLTLVEKWNIETAALHKILCYCNVWLAEKDDCDNRSTHNATQFDVCKDQTYSPNPVNYGTPAAKVACLLTSVANHPGTSGFVTQEYDSFTDFVAPVVPCTQECSEVVEGAMRSNSSLNCECAHGYSLVGSDSACGDGSERYFKSDKLNGKGCQCKENQECLSVDSQPQFDLWSYISKPWFVQQQVNIQYLPVETNYCVTARYERLWPASIPHGYTIGVFSANSDKDRNEVRTSSTCAYGTDPWSDDSDPAKLAVAPCSLPKTAAGNYWVLAYNETEGYALVSGGQPFLATPLGCRLGSGINDAGLWIFSRDPIPPQGLVQKARDIASSKGFDVSVLADVDQTNCTGPNYSP